MQSCLHVRKLHWLVSVIITVFAMLLCPAAQAQTENDKPVPLLTGGIGYFTNVEAGQTQLVPIFSPVLLAPLGDHWLIESRAEFSGEFLPQNGSVSGKLEKEVDYAQLDYIANRYTTISVGRFLTPFGIYNERLYPIWIRKLENVPIIFPIGTGSSDGVMLRGGIPISSKANINYAGYFSLLSTINKLDSDRLTGGRIGFFLPGPRLEIGTSFQQLLQEDRSRSLGFHFGWQPNRVPLNLRAEYAWSGSKGNGYWIEGAYALSQVPRWQRGLRHVELIGRAQQYFPGNLQPDDAEEYGLPLANTRQTDFGLNYYLRDGLKVTASYGREFNFLGDANIWNFGLAYRFVLPLGRTGGQ